MVELFQHFGVVKGCAIRQIERGRRTRLGEGLTLPLFYGAANPGIVLRQPAVAGTFYPHEKAALAALVESSFDHRLGPGANPGAWPGGKRIRGLLVPHAGLEYSGHVAAHAYKALAQDHAPNRLILIGPNHSGVGAAAEISLDDFAVATGTVRNDYRFGERLISQFISEDSGSHTEEHSLEVQVPFIVRLFPEAKIVPILVTQQTREISKAIGEAIAPHLGDPGTIVIASTDLSHYLPPNRATAADSVTIEALLTGSADSLFDVLGEGDPSMCGQGAAAAMLAAVKPDNGRLLARAHSGDVKPMPRVVGYASMAFG